MHSPENASSTARKFPTQPALPYRVTNAPVFRGLCGVGKETNVSARRTCVLLAAHAYASITTISTKPPIAASPTAASLPEQ